jgi:hypothetical protein
MPKNKDTEQIVNEEPKHKMERYSERRAGKEWTHTCEVCLCGITDYVTGLLTFVKIQISRDNAEAPNMAS